MTPPLVLLLGGTTEASALARLLAADAGLRTILSLAGATREPAPSPVPRRIGGFGGIAGLVRVLRENGVAVLVDATHPFAAQMRRHARAAAAEAGVPLIRLTRPGWTPGAADRWTVVGSTAEAARLLGDASGADAGPGAVLLTVGRVDLAPFRTLPHRFVLRSVDPPPADLLPPRVVTVAARGPFTLADERALFRRHGIRTLVTKNAGGEATRAKLDAARETGARVLMVARPEGEDPSALADPSAAHRLIRHACLGA